MGTAFKRELFVFKHNIFYIVYVFFFMILAVLENCIENEGTFLFSLLAILVGCLYSANTWSCESKFKFDRQATAFPVNPNHIVLSKYIMSFGISLGVGTILLLIKQVLFAVGVSGQDMLPLIPVFFAVYGIYLLILALSFFICFTFGADRALWSIIFFAFVLGFVIGFADEGEEIPSIFILGASTPYFWIIGIGGILLYAASLPLSIKLYTRRIQR